MKLEIKEEFLNWENKLLEIFIFLLSDRYSNRKSQIFSKKNSYMLMYYTKDQLIKSLERFSHYLEKDEKFIPIKTDIHEIVVNNKYEPYSYHFIINFFKEVIWWDFEKTYQVEKFITSTRDNLWILKRFFISFLEIFTNIEDFRKIFIEQIENFDEKFFNIYHKEMVYLYYLIWESFSIRNNKKIDKRLHKIKIKLLDWKALIITNSEKNIEETKMKPYYFTELEELKNKHNN